MSSTLPKPDVKVTPNTPEVEKKELVSNSDQLDSSNTVTSEPQPKEEMQVPNTARNSDISDNTAFSTRSGRVEPEDQCTEFCTECASCFGLFDSCCPADEEGCLTTAATFCGNILFGCCKAR